MPREPITPELINLAWREMLGERTVLDNLTNGASPVHLVTDGPAMNAVLVSEAATVLANQCLQLINGQHEKDFVVQVLKILIARSVAIGIRVHEKGSKHGVRII